MEVDDKLLLENTLYQMKRLEQVSLAVPEFISFINNNFPFYKIEKQKCQCKEIWDYLRNNIQYRKDTTDELLIAPHVFIYERYGDCDDYALFTHAVLTYMQKKPQYILFGKDKDHLSHIAVYCCGYVIDGCQPFFNWMNKAKYKFYKLV